MNSFIRLLEILFYVLIFSILICFYGSHIVLKHSPELYSLKLPVDILLDTNQPLSTNLIPKKE